MRFRRGDFVSIECDGTKKDGMVLMASGNGRSLVLGFDGALAGHIGTMAVLQDEAGDCTSFIGAKAVTLTRTRSET